MTYNMKTIAAMIILLGIIFVGTSMLYTWPVGIIENNCEGPNVVFSEFEQENNTGIYTTEVLEITGANKACSMRWESFHIYLIDSEGLTKYETRGVDIIDNYSGDNQENINWSSQVSNDNGTTFPVHIRNEMNNADEGYNCDIGCPGVVDICDNRWLKLSVEDKIMVYGSGSEASGPANEGWALRIIHDVTGDSLTENLVIS